MGSSNSTPIYPSSNNKSGGCPFKHGNRASNYASDGVCPFGHGNNTVDNLSIMNFTNPMVVCDEEGDIIDVNNATITNKVIRHFE